MHKCSFRVYYEDTDAGGIVYYANYLKFAERARTEFLRSCHIEQSTLATTENLLFVVRHVSMDLQRPARLDDMIDISTHVTDIGAASITLQQTLKNHQHTLVVVDVRIACVDNNLKPTKLSARLKEIFSAAAS